jgi:hypothetical protein
MAFDFPSSPALGQTYTLAGITYVWDGQKWLVKQVGLPPVKTAEPRNRLHNGAMQISQENGTTAVGNGLWPADHWMFDVISSSTVTAQKSGNSLVIAASPAETSATTNEHIQILQRIEGNDLADFALGTTGSTQFVIAFSVNAAVAGTYWVAFGTSGGSHTWLGSYTISASEATTWVRKSVIVPKGALNAGTWPIDNTLGAVLHFTFHCGPTFTGVAGFQAGNFLVGPGQALGLSTAAACAISDIGLYLDRDLTGVAPPWQFPDFADELAHCQRYWESGTFGCDGYGAAGTYLSGRVFFKVKKRISPTISGTSVGNANCAATFNTDIPTIDNFRSVRSAIAVGNIGWQENWVANARM